jgi:hypothetical protein
MRFNNRACALMDIPDLPQGAFEHIGNGKIKPQGGGGIPIISDVGSALESAGQAVGGALEDVGQFAGDVVENQVQEQQRAGKSSRKAAYIQHPLPIGATADRSNSSSKLAASSLMLEELVVQDYWMLQYRQSRRYYSSMGTAGKYWFATIGEETLLGTAGSSGGAPIVDYSSEVVLSPDGNYVPSNNIAYRNGCFRCRDCSSSKRSSYKNISYASLYKA